MIRVYRRMTGWMNRSLVLLFAGLARLPASLACLVFCRNKKHEITIRPYLSCDARLMSYNWMVCRFQEFCGCLMHCERLAIDVNHSLSNDSVSKKLRSASHIFQISPPYQHHCVDHILPAVKWAKFHPSTSIDRNSLFEHVIYTSAGPQC